MGQSVDRIHFSKQEFRDFRLRLGADLEQLQQLLRDPAFGHGPGSMGAELEVYIIDSNGRPLGKNTEIQTAMADEQLTLELNRFNLEYNLKPVGIDESPFSHTEKQLLAALEAMRQHAHAEGGRIVPVGILPTLALDDFDHRTMTDLPRFHALREKLQAERDGLFRIDIQGDDKLSLATDDITLEGANTSFQLHYRVNPDVFADCFNAIQLITPLVLALASNSPIAFGRRLWHETRIPLFKKSIDSRSELALDSVKWQQPARVNFGHGWVREGAGELFAEATRLYSPLLPIIRNTKPAGSAPALNELRLQMGTIWLWNRPVYDDTAGGHLRIEMRALPSGPTAVDMMANSALMIGLAEGLKPVIRELITALPFRHATHNFYRAAQAGIHASLIWPSLDQSRLVARPVLELARELLPVADQGLEAIGISKAERSYYLDIIAERVERRCSGSVWQLARLEELEQHCSRPEALRLMLDSYYEQSKSNTPVARWRETS